MCLGFVISFRKLSVPTQLLHGLEDLNQTSITILSSWPTNALTNMLNPYCAPCRIRTYVGTFVHRLNRSDRSANYGKRCIARSEGFEPHIQFCRLLAVKHHERILFQFSSFKPILFQPKMKIFFFNLLIF